MSRPATLVTQDLLRGQAPALEALSCTPSSAGFLALIRAFDGTGGSARSEELSRLLDERHGGAPISLASLLANNQLFVFEWRHALWIPMFQLDPHDLSPHASVREILVALKPVMSGWQLATWFAKPHPRLRQQRPADVLTADPQAVLATLNTEPFEPHAKLSKLI